MEKPDAAIAVFAAEHHGVFTTYHALQLGFTTKQIHVRHRSGLWISALQGTYRLAGTPRTWEGDVLAACWAGGFRAVASHRSAAALHGLAGGRKDFTEITCPRWRRAHHSGLVVHESKALDPLDATVVDGIPVTTVERTLLDLGAVRSRLVVTMAFDKARRTGMTTFESVNATLKRLSRQGRPGVTRLRDVLASRDPSQAPARERDGDLDAPCRRTARIARADPAVRGLRRWPLHRPR